MHKSKVQGVCLPHFYSTGLRRPPASGESRIFATQNTAFHVGGEKRARTANCETRGLFQ